MLHDSIYETFLNKTLKRNQTPQLSLSIYGFSGLQLNIKKLNIRKFSQLLGFFVSSHCHRSSQYLTLRNQIIFY